MKNGKGRRRGRVGRQARFRIGLRGRRGRRMGLGRGRLESLRGRRSTIHRDRRMMIPRNSLADLPLRGRFQCLASLGIMFRSRPGATLREIRATPLGRRLANPLVQTTTTLPDRRSTTNHPTMITVRFLGTASESVPVLGLVQTVHGAGSETDLVRRMATVGEVAGLSRKTERSGVSLVSWLRTGLEASGRAPVPDESTEGTGRLRWRKRPAGWDGLRVQRIMLRVGSGSRRSMKRI